MSQHRSPAWQALSLVEELFGYFAPADRVPRRGSALPALEQMFAYYTRS